MLAEVAEIAADAGRFAIKLWNTDFRRWEKAPGNPVCAVDLEVDGMLRYRLGELLPDAGWLSEETIDSAARLDADRIWVVDPIDGTRDYLRGRPGWAVSIALVDKGRPVLGVLDAPAREEVWVAEAGNGAFRNGERLRVAARSELAGARVPADQLSKVDHDLVMVAKPNSIALRIAMVAAGEADLLATIRWGNEWDIAAAVLLAGEAGAAVSDAFGRPLAFNTPDAQAFGVLATAPGIHAAAVERLRERAEAAVGGR
nr:3'(2'),5'-bisphosphate nucleotidase CysQ [Sphingomonas naasensis]